MQTDKTYKQLSFYNNAEFEYVYQTSNSVGQNDYLNCQTVYFYADSNLTKSFNGDCFMQLNQSQYTNTQPFKIQKDLAENQVAISHNLAQVYEIKIGSKIYSKHNTKNQVQEYIVAQILPVCYGITIVDTEINRGVIFMGFDNNYKTNTNYTYIGFAKTDPTSIIINAKTNLISLNNKSDWTNNLTQKVVLWQLIIFAIVTIITVIYAIFHWKNQKNYYKRLNICGFSLKSLKKQMFADITVPACISLGLTFVFSVLIISLCNKYFCYFSTIASVGFAFLVLIAMSFIIIKKGTKR